MRSVDIFNRAGRNLRQAKVRTLLTSLAIAVGAFTLTLSLAAGEGARQYADNLLKNNIDPQSLFIVKDKAFTESGGQVGLREYSEDISTTSSGRPGTSIEVMNENDVKKLLNYKDIKDVIPVYRFSPRYIQFEGVENKYIASTDYYDSTVLKEVLAGDLPKLGEQINDGDVVLPEEYAKTIDKKPEELIGSKIIITMSQNAQRPTDKEVQEALFSGGQNAVAKLLQPKSKDFTFTVRAVTQKSGFSIVSNPQLFVSANKAKELSDYSSKNTENAGKYIGVTALAIGDPAKIKDDLQDNYGYSVQTAKDAQSFLFTFVNILQGIVVGFAVIALIASVFGIINTQYISVLERTSQIGLMKALGMRSREIGKLFRYEAAWIGLLGGLIGASIAYVVGTLANPSISKALSLGEERLLIFNIWSIVLLIFGLVIVAIIAGWFPSRKAAKLDPIDALRTE